VLIETRESVSHQGSSNSLLHLIVASIKTLTSGIRWRCDLDEPTAEMAIESEVFANCTEEKDASIEEENREERLCRGCKYLRLTDAWKTANTWRQRWAIVPGMGSCMKLVASG